MHFLNYKLLDNMCAKYEYELLKIYETKCMQCTLVSLCVSKMDKLCIAVNHKIKTFYIHFLLFLFIKLTYTSFPSGNYYIFSSIGF